MLERYGLRDVRLKLLRWRHGQKVFRVLAPSGERFALRLYDMPQAGAQWGSPEVVRSQLTWLSALGAETDLLVPEPVPLDGGSLLGHMHPENLRWAESDDMEGTSARRSRSFVLMRWVPGGRKRGGALTSKDLSSVGSYVAGLHRHAEEYGLPQGNVLHRRDWEGAFGKSKPLWRRGEAFYSPSELGAFRAAAQRVWEDLEELGGDSGVFGVTHGDLHLGNFVFDGETVGAIDFAGCSLGYYLADLSHIRASLRRRFGDRLEPFWAAFLEGYERERPLPEDYPRYLTTFDVMRNAVAVNNRLRPPSSGDAGSRPPDPEFLRSVGSWIKDLPRR